MSEISDDIGYFTNRAMNIHATDMQPHARREAYMQMLLDFQARIKTAAMNEGLDSLNEESFKKLRSADEQ